MTLTFDKQFLIASHALAVVGACALATTHEVGALYVGIALGGLLWSFGREWRGGGLAISAGAANGSILAALVFSLVPVFLGEVSLIRAIAEFLLVLVALKGAAEKQNRDWLQIYMLSFFQLLAAAALTVEPIFALVFLAYLVIAPCVLVLYHLRREVGDSAGGHRLAEEAFVEPSLFRSIAATTIVLFVSTLVIFVIFPRAGAGYFAAPFAASRSLTGFSEEVGLGAVAALKQSDAVAMRVSVDSPERLDGPRYWRGAALTHFDGRKWRRGSQGLRALAQTGPGVFQSTEVEQHSSVVREEIILEPQETTALFVAGLPLEVRGRFSDVSTDRIGNLRAIRPIGVRTRYQVLASLGPRRTPPTAENVALPPIDPRIEELAARTVAGTGSDRAKAEALLRTFRRGFVYTLEPGDPGEEDPLVRFLFETHSGHCEYFASAYAVLLRAVGIPSLVVNGYAGGEWNSYGNYFQIRQSDAHSWVEAYVDGAWQTLDPTPAGPPAGDSWRRRLDDALDALEMRWYRYVVNYTIEDQAEAALSLRDSLRELWRRLSARWDGWDPSIERGEHSRIVWNRVSWGATAAALSLVVLVVWLWRRSGREAREAEAAMAAATRSYVRLLQALAKHGMEKRPAETPLEFYRRVAPGLDGQAEAVARVTELYVAARFSGREPLPELDRELDREIQQLIAALASWSREAPGPG